MIVSTGTRYNAGAQLPCGYEPKTSDAYYFGDYIYRYNCYNGGSTSWPVDESLNGWGVAVADKTKASYGEILETVCGKPVTTMKNAFRQCYQLIKAPTIPKYITDMSSAFSECHLLSEAPDLTNCKQLVNVSYAFLHCRALQNAPEIPEGVLNMFRTFGYSGITGVVIINATPSEYAECFTSVDMTNITLTGSTSKDVLNLIGATGRNWTPIE